MGSSAKSGIERSSAICTTGIQAEQGAFLRLGLHGL